MARRAEYTRSRGPAFLMISLRQSAPGQLANAAQTASPSMSSSSKQNRMIYRYLKLGRYTVQPAIHGRQTVSW